MLDETDNHRPKNPPAKLALYDPKKGQQIKLVDLPNTEIGYPSWSKDAQFIYFEMSVGNGWYRVRIRDRKLERLLSLSNLEFAPKSDDWMGLTPDGSALYLRETGTHEIYALDWEAP